MKKEINKIKVSKTSKTLNALKFIGKIKPKIRLSSGASSIANISIA